MVERVKITPSQILLKDSSGNIKFNTDYSYIKTGGGTLYAGGYARAPAIYGQNSIYDHTESGQYATGLLKGTFPATTSHFLAVKVPKAEGYTFKNNLTIEGEASGLPFIAPSSRFVEYLNYDTQITSNTNTTFYWKIQQYGYDAFTDSDGNTGYSSFRWEIEPILNGNILSGQSNPNGGRFIFRYSANEHLNYSRIGYVYDEFSGSVPVTQYGSQFYGPQNVTDEFGNSYTIPAKTIYIRSSSIFSTKTPVALSLAVTP